MVTNDDIAVTTTHNHNSDIVMSEYCASKIFDSLDDMSIISEDIANLISSLAILLKYNIRISPRILNLIEVVNMNYARSNVSELPGFDLGAVYGALFFAKRYKEVEMPQIGEHS